MIRVYKGKETKVVTKGAYETFYKPLGFNIVLENKQEKVIKPVKKVEDKLETLLDVVDNETVIKPKREGSNKKNKKEA